MLQLQNLRISPKFGQKDIAVRKIPNGFENTYNDHTQLKENYFDFINHRIGSGDVPFFELSEDFVTEAWPAYDVRFVSAHPFDKHLILTLQMPDDLPSLMDRALDIDVKITQKSNQKLILHDMQQHSLGLLSDKMTFRFVHMADTQINDTAFKQNSDFETHRPWRRPEDEEFSTQAFILKQATKELNFLKPDFGFISGDIVGGGNLSFDSVLFDGIIKGIIANPEQRDFDKMSYWNEYQSAVSWMRTLNFPVFTAVGNHDGFASYKALNRKSTETNYRYSNTLIGKESQPVLYDGKHFWRKTFGPLYYSFDFGKWHFVVLDTYEFRRFFRNGYGFLVPNHGGWMTRQQIGWLEMDLYAAARANKKIIMIGHHDPRGGAKGMFLHDPKLRRIRRQVLPFREEMRHSYIQMGENPYYASHGWASVESDVPGHTRPDGFFDSAAELLKLIRQYPVTHFLLGHEHSDYSDVVAYGDRKVHFIHTTTLSAKYARARDGKNYHPQPGISPGYERKWGYRIFELDLLGSIEEIFSPQDKSVSHDAHESMKLGNLRFQIGYDPHYRKVNLGALSKRRPITTWFPFGSFLKKLVTKKVVPYHHGFLRVDRWPDPYLLTRALFHPPSDLYDDQGRSMLGWMSIFYHSDDWENEPMIRRFGGIDVTRNELLRVYRRIRPLVGTHHEPKELFLLNANIPNIDGTLEFKVSKDYKIGEAPRGLYYAEDVNVVPASIKLKKIAASQTHSPKIIHTDGNSQWIQMPLRLRGRDSDEGKKKYLHIQF